MLSKTGAVTTYVCAALFLSSCADGGGRSIASGDRNFIVATTPTTQASSGSAVPSEAAPPTFTGAITLREVLARVLTENRDLAAFSYDKRLAEARTLQASLLPNPEVSADIEDFGGTGSRRGLSTAQTTLSLSQQVELGSKRAKRVQLARFDEALAGWDYEGKRLDVMVDTMRAFVGVLAVQAKLELAEQNLKIERDFFRVVSERVNAGRVSPLDQERAQASLSTSQIAVDKARRELGVSRQKLSSFWGDTSPQFRQADGDFETLDTPLPLQALLDRLKANPDLARWADEIEQRRAKLGVEKSRNMPDVKVSLGVRRYNDERSHAMVAGFSIPIPIFGINPGGVQEAQASLNKSYEERRATEVRVTSTLGQAHQQLIGAYEEVNALRRDARPAAERAFAGAEAGYRGGKFSLLEVLDAHRTLMEVRAREIEALATYHTIRADVDRLVEQSVASPVSSSVSQ